ncbi:hypothetical protein ANCDUO_26998, partial [Ancylostoma duodenale]
AKNLGIDGPLLKWIRSYLHDRLFADVVKVFGIYNDENRAEVYQALTQSIPNMLDWSIAW